MSRSFSVGNLDTAVVRIAAVLDPISEEAQIWSSLLKTASEMDNIAVSVYLEPDVQNTEVSYHLSVWALTDATAEIETLLPVDCPDESHIRR